MSSLGNQFLLNQKRFIVTGAASGIGRQTAIVLSNLGANLLLIDFNEAELDITKKLCENNVTTLLLDLTSSYEVKENLIRNSCSNGKFDGFVHCAGIPYISPLKSIDKKKFNNVFEINTFVALELAKIFINRKVFNGICGSIVFISSVYGLVGSSANVGYSMSKSAIIGLTKSLAIELAPKRIRVNCVAPGFVKTQMMSETNKSFEDNRETILSSLHPLGLGSPEDVANSIAFLLSDASKWITGIVLNVDGGFTAK
jgi:NAD(P)-dependent dehydrogenase (short-subunit alcohol dehydrogenase family)